MILGLDVGGTNIDTVLVANNKVIKFIKRPITKLSNTIIEVIELITEDIDKSMIKTINLSTTISTNLITTNKLEEVLLITQNGLGLLDKYFEVGNHNLFVSGYTDHRGQVLSNYEDNELIEIDNYIKKYQIKNIAINTKFSTRNNLTENKLYNYFKNDNNIITLGSNLTSNLNFKRRISTSYLNAGILRPFNDFYDVILKSIKDSNLTTNINILKADAGLISLGEIQSKPVESIASGPAASLLGILAIMNLDNNKKYLNMDIGGTTTDIFFSYGENYLFEEKGLSINNLNTTVRSVYFKSIPLGGDTAIIFEDNTFKFKYERLGNPVALGGSYLTITDCLNVLGGSVGDINLSRDKINEFALGTKFDNKSLSLYLINKFINEIKAVVSEELDKINSKPIYTVKEVINLDKFNIDEINIIGGPSKDLSKYFKEVFNLKVNYPKEYLYTNALGAAVSKMSNILSLYADTDQGYKVIPELNLRSKVNSSYNLNEAIKELSKYFNEDYEIILKDEFNMVDGYYTKGKNIRLVIQTKPGVSFKLGDNNEEK